MFNYLTYRIYNFFYKDSNEKAVSKTINFLVLLEGSLVIPIFMLINMLQSKGALSIGEYSNFIYIVGIPVAEILILIHSVYVKRRLTWKRMDLLDDKYFKKKYRLPMFFIFMVPVVFVFIIPMALS